MSGFRIVPLPSSVAAEVRASRHDSHRNAKLEPIRADGPGSPCRVCLRDSEAGDELLLFSYTPMAPSRAYSVVGPIFVHAKACTPYAESEGVPESLRTRLLALRAYDQDDRLLDGDVVDGREIESLIDRLFKDPRIHSIHAYNARAGCFASRIERA